MSDENEQPVQLEPAGTESKEGIQYYWCVNCGYSGNFGRLRFSRIACKECHYDLLTPFTLEEILADEHLKFKFKEFISENPPVSGP